MTFDMVQTDDYESSRPSGENCPRGYKPVVATAALQRH